MGSNGVYILSKGGLFVDVGSEVSPRRLVIALFGVHVPCQDASLQSHSPKRVSMPKSKLKAKSRCMSMGVGKFNTELQSKGPKELM
jgi:hypothetical protein